MTQKFTFEEIEIEYEANIKFQNRIIINKVQIGPWISRHTELLTFELKNRYFVCQTITNDLPKCFELIPSRESKLQTIEPPNDQ